MGNEYIEKDAVKSKKKKSRKKSKRGTFDVKVLAQIMNGDILTKENIVSHIPFIGYICLVIVMYIGYGYHTQNIAQKIILLEKEIGELNSEEVTLSTDFNRLTRRAEIEKLVEDKGLHESVDPPKKIEVTHR